MKRKVMIAMMLALCLALGAVLPAVAESQIRIDEKDLTANQRIGSVNKTYYVSGDGDDENDGLSESSAFKTFASINTMVLTPGDCVLLRRGDVFHERLVIRGSGKNNAWIFVGAYGDEKADAPEISLNNSKDDICILVSDILSSDYNTNGFDYIWIDGIKCSNSCLGIYFRTAYSANNRGVRVTNCKFDNMNCPDVMNEALTTTAFLSQTKGNLPTVSGNNVNETGGGAYEYIWPAAITFGGRPVKAMSATVVEGKAQPYNSVREIELYQNYFENCIFCVSANAYNIHYGAGPDQCFTYTQDWKIQGLTSKNSMTMFNFDSADFGWDGTAGSKWGIFSNIQALSGMSGYTMSMGTTQALFSACKNLYIRNSQFNGCKNNGQADGCGFDFERADFNFLLENCIFAENEGQAVLMMQTTMENQVTHEQVTTGNGDCTLKNCLFYNNFRNVYNENYKYDFEMFNTQNTNIKLIGCFFYEPRKTSGSAQVFIDRSGSKTQPYGPEKKGVTCEDCEIKLTDDLPELGTLINQTGLDASTVVYMPKDKIWSAFTGDILPDETAAGETESEVTTAEGITTGEEITTAEDTSDVETGSEAITDTATSEAAVTPTGNNGCKSYAGAAVGISTVMSAAVLIRKKKEN